MRTFVQAKCNHIVLLFTNNVGKTFITHPDFVHSPCINVDPITNTIRRLHSVFFFRICDGQLAFQYQVGSKASMGVWTVMGISGGEAVSPTVRRGYACWATTTYGPSVHLNTCENPHDRTCASGLGVADMILVILRCW